MTRHVDTAHGPNQGLPDKCRSILRGALLTFARDGYTRASIDTIAREAGVSTRTIYNHFEGKAELFRSVIQDSAAQVATAQIAVIDRHLRKVTDLEADLIEFGREWATPMPDFLDHFALVRQINAEFAHIPEAALEAWQETGPRRVARELARRMRLLADAGHLDLDDPDRAATHFTLLATAEVMNRSRYGAVPLAPGEIAEIATAGVRAFLRAYRR